MRRTPLLAAVCIVLLVSLSGCALGPAPLQGLWYSDICYPSLYDGAAEKGPGPKTGTATAESVLSLIALGDASVDAACRDGGISAIHTVDHHYWSILGIFSRFSTTVTGE